MISFLACLALSETLITELGNYSAYVSKYGTAITLNLPNSQTEYYYIVFSNPVSSLFINREQIKSSVYRIPNEIILYLESETEIQLQFFILKFNENCEALEFIINPSNDMNYFYDAADNEKLYSKFYCAAFVSSEDMDLKISTETPSVLRVSEYTFEYSKSNNSAKVDMKNVRSVCIGYRPGVHSSERNLIINITNAASELLDYVSGYYKSGSHYITENPIQIDMPGAIRKLPGTYTVNVTNKPVSYVIPQKSYVVFTKSKDLYGYATSGNSLLEILGTTKIVTVYYNISGTLQLYTYKPQTEASFIIFKLDLTGVNDIVTAVGCQNSAFESNAGHKNVLVSAFHTGTFQVKWDGTAGKSYRFDGSEIYDPTISAPFYTIIDSTNGNKSVKHVTKDRMDITNPFIIQGEDSNSTSYSIHDAASSKQLNAGRYEKPDDDNDDNDDNDENDEKIVQELTSLKQKKKGLTVSTAIISIICFALIAVIVILFLKQKKLNKESSGAGELHDSLVKSETKQDKASYPAPQPSPYAV